MYAKELDNALEAQINVLESVRRARARGRRVRLRRPIRQQHPDGVALAYRRQILRVLSLWRESIRDTIIRALPSLVAEASILRPEVDHLRMDQNLTQRIVALFLATRASMDGKAPEGELVAITQAAASLAEQFNLQQFQRLVRSVVGVDIFQAEPYLEETVRGFIAENVALIRNVQEQVLTETQRVVFTGMRRGLRANDIAQRILGKVDDPEGFKSVFRKAETRAKLIARDQIAKINGQLNELRQTNAGISRYIWRTSLDSRVRPEHASREGKTFSWDKAPSDGHPGEPINCRCSAEPVFDDLV